MKQLRLFGYLLAIIGMMSFHYAFAQKVETKYVRITPGEGKQLHLYFLTQDMSKLTIEGGKETGRQESGTHTVVFLETIAKKQIKITGEFTFLKCSSDDIQALDFSGSTKIVQWQFTPSSALKDIDLSGMSNLRSLIIKDINVETISIIGCHKLKDFYIDSDFLKNLDFSSCLEIESISVNSTSLENLNITGCKELKVLKCPYAPLTKLQIQSYHNLKTLHCGTEDHTMELLQIIDCPQLSDFELYPNRYALHGAHIKSIDIDGCPLLKSFVKTDRAKLLENLKLRNCSGISKLHVDLEKLQHITIENCPALKDILITNNALSLSEMRKLCKALPEGDGTNVIKLLNFGTMVEYNCMNGEIADAFTAHGWKPIVHTNKGDDIDYSAVKWDYLTFKTAMQTGAEFRIYNIYSMRQLLAEKNIEPTDWVWRKKGDDYMTCTYTDTDDSFTLKQRKGYWDEITITDPRALLTSVEGIGKLESLKYLDLRGQLLETVDFSPANTALVKVDISNNRIQNMQSIVDALPTVDKKYIIVYDHGAVPTDQNVCTKEQVEQLKAKGWVVIAHDGDKLRYFVGNGTTNGINEISDSNEEVKAVYTINGVRIKQVQSGINIVKMANGKTKKIIIP